MKKLINKYLLLSCQILWANTLHVPAEYSTIQDGINASAAGDTILIANGIYYEQLVISNKSVTIASDYLTTHNPTDITQTIIDGEDNSYVISIENSAGNETFIHGLTLQNGDDGISPFSAFRISNCIIKNCDDGIDYENGSGGICINNLFENNGDDGIDLDDAVDILIENNRIINNSDDGIEVRLQSYNGPTLNIIIKNNIVTNNGEDGIQLIDYPDLSDRYFRIENNLIANNTMAGIGLMADGNTTENYEGAAIPEPIFLINNTIDGNNHGITGGKNLTAFNNIISNCTVTGLKNVTGSSLISYSALWNNGQNFDNCIINSSSMVFADPLFISNTDYHIKDTSPCIQKGNPAGSPSIDIEYTPRGNPPDIGAYENISDGSQALLTGPQTLLNKKFFLDQNYPNPFNPTTIIKYDLKNDVNVEIEIFNSLGQKVKSLLNNFQIAGYKSITWDGTNDNGEKLGSGIYFYKITAGDYISTKKMILIR